jgi:hypothetical protein
VGPVEVTNNTFYRCFTEFNSEAGGSGASIGGLPAELHGNIVAASKGEAAIHNFGDLDHACNVFWDNQGGDYHYSEGNDPPPDLLADPQFCDPEVLDFTVRASSPCAPGNSPGCGLIGAWPVGCGSIRVEAMSWGRIKDLYR